MGVLGVLFVFGLLFGPLIIAIVALSKAKKSGRQVEGLRARILALRDELRLDLRTDLQDLRHQLGLEGQQVRETEEQRVEPSSPWSPAEEETPFSEEVQSPPEETQTPPPESTVEERPGRLKELEESLTSRWLVWLGAIAIALGGTFLVKFAIEEGWLGPGIRVSLGFMLGIALAVGGEWLRRRPLQRALAAIRPNYVPPSLTASGLFIGFASIYAAYGLYNLIPPLVAFVGLAAVALAGVGLSLLQGPFVAVLGLVGAFVTPALVTTTDPSAWALFSYLLVVQAACLAVLRYRAWYWLAFATLAGAALWPLIWMAGAWKPTDALPLGVYLTLMAMVFLSIGYRIGLRERADGWLQEMRALEFPHALGWISAITVSVLMFVFVGTAEYDATSLTFLGLVSVLFLVAGRGQQVFDGLAVVAGAMVVVVMITWQLPATVTHPRPLFQFQGMTAGTVSGTPLVPPELTAFVIAGLAFAALFGGGGFAALWGARRPAFWAGVSAFMPVLLLAIAYWRVIEFQLDFRWAVVALVFSVASVFGATQVERHRRAQGLIVPLGFYCAAVVASLSLGAAMILQQAWLTVALSIQLPALAWIYNRLNAPSIQGVAAIIAGIVLIRLVFNYNVIDYPLGEHPLFNWVLYGYGIPALMFYWTARLFRAGGTATLVMLLQAGALAFSVLLVTLQIRVLLAGSVVTSYYGLLEQSLQTIAWLSIGYVLAIHYQRHKHPVSKYGHRILLALASAQIVILQLWLSNPLLTQEAVGGVPVFNALFLAYLVPSVLMFRTASVLHDEYGGKLAQLIAGLGFILVFAYVTLEVRRAFHGSVLQATHQSDVELYVYSLAWLAFSGVLLALGIFRKQSVLRYASLAVLLLTVLKVFIIDIGDLTGLLRVASFLGLGLTLVGIGYLYQRFVFRQPALGGASQESDME